MAKVVVLLSPTQRTKLLQIPDTFSEREITRYYSLSSKDLTVIEQHRRPQNRLGFTVQLAYLRFPGRPWDPQEQVPPAILTYLAEQIGEAPDVLADYASRDPTRREHLSEIQRVFHFHLFTMQTYRGLSRWLMPIALSTDQGIALMEALIEELRARHVLLPAISTLEPLGWETRRRAQQQMFTILTEGLSEEQRMQLGVRLVVPTDARRTPLAWLREPPGQTLQFPESNRASALHSRLCIGSAARAPGACEPPPSAGACWTLAKHLDRHASRRLVRRYPRSSFSFSFTCSRLTCVYAGEWCD